MPTEIPENIEVDISELLIGQGVRLREVLDGVPWSPVSDPDTLLVHVIAPKIEEEETPEEEEVAEGVVEGTEEGGEPEVIKKGKAEDGEDSGS